MKKIFSILFALVLVVSLGLVTAGPDQTGGPAYAAGAQVSTKAVAKSGYGFVSWTAAAASFSSASAAATAFTTPPQDVSVTANFAEAEGYTLTMAVSPAGTGTATDMSGASPYAAGVAVSIKAVPAAGYGFVNWTAPAGSFGNANAATTTFTMPAQDVTVTANFAVAGPTTWYVVEGGAGDRTGVSSDEAFADIQDAVDAADEGDTITVAAGLYGAFWVVGKTSITIIGTEGATVGAAELFPIERGPIVLAWSMAVVKDSQDIDIHGIDFDGTPLSQEEVVVGIAYIDSTGTIADLSVENVSGVELGVGVAIIGEAGTSVVTLGGVTVRESMAGVIIWDAEANINGCTFTLMRPNGGFDVMGSGVGIVIGIPGDAWQGPSVVKVKGSTISDNDDIGIYVCDGSVVEAQFNNIVGNTALGVLNDGGERVDAVYNWWGGAAGPLHPSNPAGAGNNAVSDNVDFEPWLRFASKTETVIGDGLVDARAEADMEVWVWVRGTTTMVTVSKYVENPGREPTTGFIPLHKWGDVYVPDTGHVSEIEIRLYYTAAEVGDVSEAAQKFFRLLWWNGTECVPCSDTGVDTNLDYIWAKVTRDTTPSLDDLEGTPFGGYAFSPGVPRPWCFIATAAYGTDTATEIDILREFRDVVLLPGRLGARFVSLYYATSPPLADLISQHEVLRTVLRAGFVDPIVAVLTWSQGLWLGTRL